MEHDFSTLLTEYSKLLSHSKKGDNNVYVESLQVIPILLKTGTFTPSRLDYWPFPQISEKISSDPDYHGKFLEAFIKLVSNSNDSNAFTLNEKKGVAFLLAAREKFPQLLIQLFPAIKTLPRMILACLEYKIFIEENEHFVVEICRQIPIPFPAVTEILLPKLNTLHSLLFTSIVRPSINNAEIILDALNTSENPSLQYYLIASLECSARSIDSKDLYSRIIKPIWGTENIQLARIVFSALSQCPQLERFCNECIKDL